MIIEIIIYEEGGVVAGGDLEETVMTFDQE
jgi:hypothetical protein